MMPINSLCALYPSCLQNVSFFMFLLFYVFTFPHQNLNYIFVFFCLQAVVSWCCWGYVCIMRWRIWEWDELIAVRHGHQRLEEIRERGQVMESKQTQGKRLKSKAQSEGIVKEHKGKRLRPQQKFLPSKCLKMHILIREITFFFQIPNFLVAQLYTFDLILGFKNTEWQGKLYKNH